MGWGGHMGMGGPWGHPGAMGPWGGPGAMGPWGHAGHHLTGEDKKKWEEQMKCAGPMGWGGHMGMGGPWGGPGHMGMGPWGGMGHHHHNPELLKKLSDPNVSEKEKEEASKELGKPGLWNQYPTPYGAMNPWGKHGVWDGVTSNILKKDWQKTSPLSGYMGGHGWWDMVANNLGKSCEKVDEKDWAKLGHSTASPEKQEKNHWNMSGDDKELATPDNNATKNIKVMSTERSDKAEGLNERVIPLDVKPADYSEQNPQLDLAKFQQANHGSICPDTKAA